VTERPFFATWAKLKRPNIAAKIRAERKYIMAQKSAQKKWSRWAAPSFSSRRGD
jgi:hypothetical protein